MISQTWRGKKKPLNDKTGRNKPLSLYAVKLSNKSKQPKIIYKTRRTRNSRKYKKE